MTINEVQDQIIADFSCMTDWFAKYEYLIEMGKQHPGLSEAYKTDAYALAGCQSQVWIVAQLNEGRVALSADSDTVITKGMIALLVKVLNGHPPETVAQANIYFTNRTGLATNLSPARANGLETIIRRMRYLGEQLS